MRQSSGNKREKKAREVARTIREPEFESMSAPLLEKTHLRQDFHYSQVAEGEETRWSYFIGVRPLPSSISTRWLAATF
jgi:hypothetical protein